MSEDALMSTDRMLQAFRVIDDRCGDAATAGSLLALRERLAGELLGDDVRVAATLAPDFALVTHTGGPATTIAGRDMVDGIRRQGNAGVVIWTELDDLVAAPDVVAGHGLLHTFSPDPRAVATCPLAFFIRYAEGFMTSEVAFMDVSAATTTSLPNGTTPSIERLQSIRHSLE